MLSPVTIANDYPHWHFDTGILPYAQLLALGVDPTNGGDIPCYFIHARRDRHHILVMFDQWNFLAAESLEFGILQCDDEDGHLKAG